jgi:DeoR family transcriptional regulator of aga operon
MLDVERRQRVVDFIERNGQATVDELSRHFDVSTATARRDLGYLSQRGLIERAHGGAVSKRVRHDHGFSEPPVPSRASLQLDEKQRIGEAAARHVTDGDVIIISAGTTTAAMVPHLADRKGLTVMTNALNVATVLATYRAITVVILGGVLRHDQLSMSGALTEDALKNLRADKLFMGTPAIHVDYGLSAPDLSEVQSGRALITAANDVIVLCDHTKFGKVATMRVAGIEVASRIITDAGTSVAELDSLSASGIAVETV